MPDILTLSKDGAPLGFLAKKVIDTHSPKTGSVKLLASPPNTTPFELAGEVTGSTAPIVTLRFDHVGFRRDKEVSAGWVLRVVDGPEHLSNLQSDVFVFLAESKFVIPDIWYGPPRR